MENDDLNQITYLLLQHKYLEIMGFDNSNDDEIMKNSFKYFPDEWWFYSYKRRIDLISIAIKNKENLRDVVYNNTDKNEFLNKI